MVVMIRRAGIFFSLFLAAAVTGSVAAGGATFDETLARIQEVEKAIDRKDIAAVRKAINGSPDPVAPRLAEWLAYRQGLGEFGDISGFLERHPGWPSAGRLRLNAERKIDGAASPDVVISFFKASPPKTDNGALLYLKALLARGFRDEASSYAREVWSFMTFDSRTEKEFLKVAAPFLRKQDHQGRLDRLLWDGHAISAKRMYPKVGRDLQLLADARIRLRKRQAGVDAAIGRVPGALLSDPGLVFERARWRRRAGNWEGAAELLLDKNSPDVGSPGRWWDERSYVARYLLRKGHITDAYRLAASYGSVNDADQAEALWLAGWVALRFLEDAKLARSHFEKLHASVSYPISVARGAYWSGRAAEAMGDMEAASRWYRTAATQSMTYYGQLAAARVGIPAPPLEAAPPPAIDPATRAAFADEELARAARYAAALKDSWPLRQLVEELFDRMPDITHRNLAASLAVRLGRPDLGVRLAKQALLDGQVLADSGYPQVPVPNDGARVEAALTHAIIRQESVFDAEARSPAGARGLMQLMPATAREVSRSLKVSYRVEKLTDADFNMRLGRAYFASLLEDFNGSYIMAIAGYNAGPHRVKRWIGEFGDPRNPDVDPIDWVESIPFSETRNYVQRVLENLQVYRHIMSGVDLAEALPDDLRRACDTCQ
jgi:soluble lytic murein transglycosylase